MDVIAQDRAGAGKRPAWEYAAPGQPAGGWRAGNASRGEFGGAGSAPPARPIGLPIGKPRERAYKLVAILAFVDLGVTACGILLGLTLRSLQGHGNAWPFTELVHGGTRAEAWVFGGAVVHTWLMAFFRTYEVENIYRLQFWAMNLGKSSVLWVLICLAAIGLFQLADYAPRLGLLFAVTCIFGLLSIWRLLAFAILSQPKVLIDASDRLICVGWNAQAERLRQALRHDVSELSEIIGCVPGPDARLRDRPPGEVSILGSYQQLARLVRDCKATGIVLTDTSLPAAEIQRLVVFCQRQSLDFKMIPAYFPALRSGLQVRNFNGVPLLGVTMLPLDLYMNRFAKRLMDIVGSLFGIVVSIPVVALFGLLVVIESRGPVFFRQLRMSRSGRTFYIYKIRSMRPDAEAKSGPVWSGRDDPRRLKVGVFMRRWNIDELPQFLNVLIGEMSLVGPRPERPELVERFKDTIRNYNARHEVKSGVSGWAQIHGYRGDTDLSKRVEHDLYYLENWSVFLDAYILLGTVFKHKNAC